MTVARRALDDLWAAGGGAATALEQVDLTEVAEFLPSVFPVTAAAAALVAATGLAAAELDRARGGSAGRVAVSGRHAAAAFRSERYVEVDGSPPPSPWDELSGYYRAAGGEWVQLHCNFPHHRQGVVDLLGVDDTRAAVEVAIATMDAQDLEDRLAAAGMCASRFRSTADWADHPHGRHIRSSPLLTIEPPDDPNPRAHLTPEHQKRAQVRGDRGQGPGSGPRPGPLAGMRVLDLSRVLAGPVCGRTLAALGADVVRVGADHLPVISSILPDTNLGKRFTHLDLRTEAGRTALWSLVADADVLIDGFRPGALAALGFDRPSLWARCPGLVVVELSAYGADGPWGGRRGFDSLVQTASGIGWAGMEAAGADGPHPLPAQVLDHGTGWLAAFGALRALTDRAGDGRGRVVDTALARTGAWLDRLGRIDGMGIVDPGPATVADLLDELDGPDGRVGHVRFPFMLDGLTTGWTRTGSSPGIDAPIWTT